MPMEPLTRPGSLHQITPYTEGSIDVIFRLKGAVYFRDLPNVFLSHRVYKFS